MSEYPGKFALHARDAEQAGSTPGFEFNQHIDVGPEVRAQYETKQRKTPDMLRRQNAAMGSFGTGMLAVIHRLHRCYRIGNFNRYFRLSVQVPPSGLTTDWNAGISLIALLR